MRIQISDLCFDDFLCCMEIIKEELIYGNKLTFKSCNYQHMGEGFMYNFLLLLCVFFMFCVLCILIRGIWQSIKFF